MQDGRQGRSLDALPCLPSQARKLLRTLNSQARREPALACYCLLVHDIPVSELNLDRKSLPRRNRSLTSIPVVLVHGLPERGIVDRDWGTGIQFHP